MTAAIATAEGQRLRWGAAPSGLGAWTGVPARPETIPRAARLAPGWLAGAMALIWPALRNGYPLVFSDTGTYLSQAIQHYLGWDRPAFYSLFLLSLHFCITTWPAVLAQGLIATLIIGICARMTAPGISAVLLAALAVASPLPFFVSQLMPDVFTGLLALALLVLVVAPERLGRWERRGLMLFAAFAFAAHLSNLPIGVGLVAALLPLRRVLGARATLGFAGWRRLIAAPVLAVMALMAANLAGHGRASIAPYGNVFLLTRVIYDGPGLDALRTDCPRPGWRLCRLVPQFPANADRFLWSADGPVVRAGGAKLVSREAGAIILAAVRAEPWREVRAMLRNTARQLAMFHTGDGLHPWPGTVTPWIDRDFPRFEQRDYAASRQTRGLSVLPAGLAWLHEAIALGAIGACLLLLPGALRRRRLGAGVIVTMLLTLLLNAAVTGALSGPHDRYQSRVMWLPLLAAVLAGAEAASSRARPASGATIAAA